MIILIFVFRHHDQLTECDLDTVGNPRAHIVRMSLRRAVRRLANLSAVDLENL